MDTSPPKPIDHTKAERLLIKAQAVNQARQDKDTGIPSQDVHAEMLRMIEDLDKEIAALKA